nr:Tn3 family transposase [Streptomyces sp. NRRL WC-3626]
MHEVAPTRLAPHSHPQRSRRIAKTLHILRLADEPGYRRQIKMQANLQDGRHALARKIFGRAGQLYQRYQDGTEDLLRPRAGRLLHLGRPPGLGASASAGTGSAPVTRRSASSARAPRPCNGSPPPATRSSGCGSTQQQVRPQALDGPDEPLWWTLRRPGGSSCSCLPGLDSPLRFNESRRWKPRLASRQSLKSVHIRQMVTLILPESCQPVEKV